MAVEKQAKSDEALIKDIRARYGDIIDLRQKPFVLIEIIRNLGGGVLFTPDAGVSVAGVGSPPGPQGSMGSLGNVVDNVQLMKEVLKLSRQVAVLTERIEALAKARK
jgi:hypothetical protein